jgi:transposase
MDGVKPKTRRHHDSELKSLVLAECSVAGASVAKVAMNHGINANLVHKWRREASRSRTAVSPVSTPREFVAVALPAPVETLPDIRIDLRRGQTSITVTWPMSAAAECGCWLRELLR